MGKEVSTVTCQHYKTGRTGQCFPNGTERYLAMWKALSSPAILVLRWKKITTKKSDFQVFPSFSLLRSAQNLKALLSEQASLGIQ